MTPAFAYWFMAARSPVPGLVALRFIGGDPVLLGTMDPDPRVEMKRTAGGAS
jgi:hypothetical protein